MQSIEIGEWIALYAAILSTVLAMVTFLKWLLGGPKLAVIVFNPAETDLGRNGAFLSIVTNSGTAAVVVWKVEVSFRTSRWFWGKELGKAVFDERSRWKPSVKLVPLEGKPNTSREVPNIILPNEEIRAPARPIASYKSDQHWICVTATPRNSRRRFSGWAAPIVSTITPERQQ